MSKIYTNLHNKRRRRVILLSVSLLAGLAVGGLVFIAVEKIHDAVDRAH